MREWVEWILEYGKYALVAAAIFFGLDRAGHEIGAGIERILISNTGTIVAHSTFVGKGDGPFLELRGLLLEMPEKGISVGPKADK